MDFGSLAEAVRPWVSTVSLVGLLGLCVKLFLDNRRMTLDTDGGIRDHYAREVASLRKQLIDVTLLSDTRLASAQKLYDEAMEAAKRRHDDCERTCDTLRQKVVGLERMIEQLSQTSMKMFEPRADLPEEQKAKMRSMEQSPVARPIEPRRARR
jgi:hypothetical protein